MVHQNLRQPWQKESINYIDFSAVENVNEQTLNALLNRAEKESVPEDEYVQFRNDLEQASRLVYLTDNCGEIVLDKLFIKCLQECYPELQIIVVVREERTKTMVNL